MGKYGAMLKRAQDSVEYWAQLAMRRFVGEALRKMDDGNISRAQLAANMKVSPAYVTKILRGDVNFTLESMVKLARAVGGRLDVRIVEASAVDSWSTISVPKVNAPGVARAIAPSAKVAANVLHQHFGSQQNLPDVGQDDNYLLAA